LVRARSLLEVITGSDRNDRLFRGSYSDHGRDDGARRRQSVEFCGADLWR
jgi:hypothetical protein